MKSLSPQVKRLAHDIWRAIGTPLSHELMRLSELGDWDTIARCKVDPRAYTSSQEYFLDASSASFLKKYKDLPTTVDRRGAALANWRLGEDDCFRTNRRLSPYLEGWSHPSCNMDVYQHIAGIRKKIATALGRCPSIDELSPSHGPGATFSDKSIRSTLADKMEGKASLTGNALWYLTDWLGTAWGRESLKRCHDPVFVRGNRFTVAPKDATKDRPIAAEPSINIFYQLALGKVVRRRLKKLGIDLDNGQDTHRQQARASSITGSLATLDLKNASDTVAYNLVKLLLPPAWFELFYELRSPLTRMASKDVKAVTGRESSGTRWIRLEKFSSMGNGFTFELETLLFWAISDYSVRSVVENPERTLCYGDDIICDSRGVGAVIPALRFFGFTINEEKSFVSGSFRESCGGDFWDGRPVRPVFLKESLDEPHQLIAAANQVRRLGFDLFGGLGPFAPIWFAIQDQLPVRVRRCRGPQGLGDIVIHDLESNWSWTSSAKDRVYCYRPVNFRKVSLRGFSDGTVFACGLYGVRVSEGYVNPRDSVTGYSVRKVMAYGSGWLPTPYIRPSWSVPTSRLAQRGPDYEKKILVVVKRPI